MKTITKILISALIISLIWLLLSCGARKVQKSETKEKTKTELTENSVIEKQSESNVKTETTVKVDDKNQTVTEETIYKPEDPTKESFLIEKDGTKTSFSNITKTVKKTTQNNNTQSEQLGKTEQLKKDASKEQKSVKHINTSEKENSVKNVEKKQFNLFELLWLLIPIIIIYVFYRIYKKLPLVPKI